MLTPEGKSYSGPGQVSGGLPLYSCCYIQQRRTEKFPLACETEPMERVGDENTKGLRKAYAPPESQQDGEKQKKKKLKCG